MPWPTTSKRRESRTASAAVLSVTASGGEHEHEQHPERPKTSLFRRRDADKQHASSSLPRYSSSPPRVMLQGAAPEGSGGSSGDTGVAKRVEVAQADEEEARRSRYPPLVDGAPPGGIAAPKEGAAAAADDDEFFDAEE